MRVRAGVVVCPIWNDIGITAFNGEFAVLIHYAKTAEGTKITAAYTRYRGALTNISDKIRTLMIPGWEERVPGYQPAPTAGYSIGYD